MNIRRLDSLDVPELEPYRTLREKTWHWQGGHFVAESEKVVYALLESGIGVVSMLLTEEWLAVHREVAALQELGDTDIFVVPEQHVQSIVGYSLHQGVMAIGRIPENPTITELLRTNTSAPLYVALEGITDAENMGMILRNCAAFGVDGVLIGGESCSPWLRRSVRVSVGHMFQLRIRICKSLVGDLIALRSDAGVRVVGAAPRRGSATALAERGLSEVSLQPQCLLFGSEAHGLSEQTFAACDDLFSIPMHNGVDSINVANAVAVALYAATAAETR
jgi:tRNA G18 (ribose-2'-O)-methylase SpoU